MFTFWKASDVIRDLTRAVKCSTVEPRLSEIKGADQFRISNISDNSEIRLDVIRCNKNNIYSETRLMLIKFMAQ